MKKRKTNIQWERLIYGGAAILLFLVIWQILVKPGSAKFATPLEVGEFILQHITTKVGPCTIWGHAGWSLSRVGVGYILAAAAGIVLALLMSQSKVCNIILHPLFDLLRPIPPIAWVPLAILWFGIFEKAKYFIIFIGAFVPFVMNTYTGAVRVDKKLIDAALMLGTPPRTIFFRVVFPAIVPQIFAGAQVALTNAWMTVIGAEMARATEGVGWMILKGMENADMAQIVSGMAVIGVTGFLIAALMRWLEKHLIKWNVRER
ncbi:ABC transporter permease [Mediterraneibacter sp. NSJ-55]|uniref:ABC transporter permease n=1 Tax=Mediterraneibacter hominis TaxID=2763054 RepID=A0A923RS59_9FIRM|nr:ABC transporter permease [Mediterraneibacter hominis]MBC5690453.1 ABC transporter permease [Mediterraneibacter hominis]